MSGAISSPTATGISHHPSAHARTPRVAHSLRVLREPLRHRARHRAERVADRGTSCVSRIGNSVAEAEQRIASSAHAASDARVRGATGAVATYTHHRHGDDERRRAPLLGVAAPRAATRSRRARATARRAPPGTRNGMPPLRTSRRRSSRRGEAARRVDEQHRDVRRDGELLEAARRARARRRSTVCTTIATYGVRQRGCTRASARGRKPSRAEREQHARHGERHPAHVAEHRDRRADEDQRASRTARAPRPPRTASGVAVAGERGAEHPLRDELDRDVQQRDDRHRDEDRARHRARRILHLAARHERALDAEEGEDEQHRRARDVAAARRASSRRRFDQRIGEQRRRRRAAASGSSFATVATALNRVTPPHAAHVAPRTSATSTTTSAIARARRRRAPERARPSESAKKRRHRRHGERRCRPRAARPTTKPTNGPNAVSTYAYGPPVIDTRLPASAKQSTMSPIATVQTRYASGAAAPSSAATPDGQPEDAAADRDVDDAGREPPACRSRARARARRRCAWPRRARSRLRRRGAAELRVGVPRRQRRRVGDAAREPQHDVARAAPRRSGRSPGGTRRTAGGSAASL